MSVRARLVLLFALVLAPGTHLSAAPPRYALEITPAREVEATYTTTVHLPKFDVSEWKFIMA